MDMKEEIKLRKEHEKEIASRKISKLLEKDNETLMDILNIYSNLNELDPCNFGRVMINELEKYDINKKFEDDYQKDIEVLLREGAQKKGRRSAINSKTLENIAVDDKKYLMAITTKINEMLLDEKEVEKNSSLIQALQDEMLFIYNKEEFEISIKSMLDINENKDLVKLADLLFWVCGRKIKDKDIILDKAQFSKKTMEGILKTDFMFGLLQDKVSDDARATIKEKIPGERKKFRAILLAMGLNPEDYKRNNVYYIPRHSILLVTEVLETATPKQIERLFNLKYKDEIPYRKREVFIRELIENIEEYEVSDDDVNYLKMITKFETNAYYGKTIDDFLCNVKDPIKRISREKSEGLMQIDQSGPIMIEMYYYLINIIIEKYTEYMFNLKNFKDVQIVEEAEEVKVKSSKKTNEWNKEYVDKVCDIEDIDVLLFMNVLLTNVKNENIKENIDIYSMMEKFIENKIKENNLEN